MKLEQTSVSSVLYDPDTQRTLMGLLVEKLGGSVTVTAEEVRLSPAMQGTRSLYVELDDGKLTFSVIADA